MKFFDMPNPVEEMEKFKAVMDTICTVISLQALQDDNQPESVENETEDYGPKTAAMPDPTVYLSDQLEDLIDVGSLPEHLQQVPMRQHQESLRI